MTTGEPAVAFRDVYRHFGEHEVLRGLSFAVRRGEIHALLGRNGCGKTTALRVLLGFLSPHRGRSEILGVGSDALTPADRGRVGYVTEGHQLYPGMRVREVLSFEAATRPRFRLDLAERAVQRCALPRQTPVIKLSRGQRAQLSLIVAVAAQPEVLVCDDPAMGLDVVMRRELLDVMIELLSERGISVLFSSHILTDVERIADRVSILHEGRLIVDAAVDDLKQRVRKRSWRPSNGATAPPSLPGLLRARRTGEGYDLTLVSDELDDGALRQLGGVLGEPVVPTLEDLFLDVTTNPADGGILSRATDAEVSA
ncbi:MAG: ABC transporter ATP-binding protein [Planctomycetota bacterium]